MPFAGLIALFVGIADLIPLVGATLGGAVAVIAGFIHSVPAGIAVLVFFVLYQQLENHLLQPLIFARTVKLNPLTVIIAILIGVELMGILGALLAIPVASMIQVILRDVWDHRRGQLKDEPTVGEDREPAVETVPATDPGSGTPRSCEIGVPPRSPRLRHAKRAAHRNRLLGLGHATRRVPARAFRGAVVRLLSAPEPDRTDGGSARHPA